MNITRRGLIGAAATVISISGCAGQDSDPGGDSSGYGPENGASGGDNAVQVVPHGVTAVLQGAVEQRTIVEKFNLSDSDENRRIYQEDRDSSTVTYFVYTSSETTVSEMRDGFGKVDGFTVENIRPGVGPRSKQEFRSAIEEKAQQADEIDADEISFSETISDGQQVLTFATDEAVRPLVPVLPKTAIKRVVEYYPDKPSDAEPLLDTDDLDFENGFSFTRNEAVGLIFGLSLNSTGADTLREEVAKADNPSRSRAFLQLVVDGEPIGSYKISAELVNAMQEDSWDRTLRLPIGTDEKARKVMEFSGMPELPFDFRISR